MSNQTTLTEFLLLEFYDVRELQILHFLVFLLIYLAALMGNLLIITAVALNLHLQTAMYLFLVNLTIMAYDRYVAICQPLHFERVMNRRACVQMAASAWIIGIVYSALHTGNTFRLPFCQFDDINQFLCEIPQLLKLTCSDSYLSEVWGISLGVFLLLNYFVFIIVSYVQIFQTVLRIPSQQGRHKAFFTCLPHLTVVSLMVFTGIFAYLKPTSSSASGLDLVVGVIYSLVLPVMNPIIYTMRDMEINAALKKLIVWRLFTKS